MLKEIGEMLPETKEVLIDERDTYLAAKIKHAKGKRIVAIVGAGHVRGIITRLEHDVDADLDNLQTIPPPSPLWQCLAWVIPLIIIGSLVWIGYNKGLDSAGENLQFWILANGIPSAIGAMAALAHPLTIAIAFAAAPLTSLTPVIGAGYVTAFVQAWLRPPRVKEIQEVAEDIGSVRAWWRNRLLRIFLAFLFPGFGSFIGTWVGGIKIFRNLF